MTVCSFSEASLGSACISSAPGTRLAQRQTHSAMQPHVASQRHDAHVMMISAQAQLSAVSASRLVSKRSTSRCGRTGWCIKVTVKPHLTQRCERAQ